MKKQFVIFCSIISLTISSFSQPISFEEAKQTARNFLGKSQKNLLSCAKIAVSKNDTLYYIFNANNGFVVVSADRKTIPILAYSDAGTYDSKNVIPPVKMWLDYYQSQLSAIRNDTEFLPEDRILRSWEALKTPSKSHKNTNSSMQPLLTSQWGQGRNYNYYCPFDASSIDNKRAVTGCVATAMAQLMYYFRFPQQGRGSYSYTHDIYGILSEDFSQASYNYSAMTDKPTQINTNISLLTYHCGIAVDMVYGPRSSGMYNHKAAYAMRTYFGFSNQTKYLYRDSTNLNWDSVIVSHLDNKVPLYYAGWSVPHTDGHAFICDAYQVDSNDNYYYHFNFGWEGHVDGYFYTNALYPSGNNFTLAQELIINAYPDTNNYEYPIGVTTGVTILKSEEGSLTDGSLYDCLSGIDYTWVIQPEVDLIQSITLDLSFQLTQGDTIFVTSGDGTIHRILTDTSSSIITTSSNELMVRFITTSNIASEGFKGNYTTKYTKFCGNTGIQYTDKQGSFDDGSGIYRYNNLAYCGKMIKVKGVNSITLSFSKFETEKDKDILYISDYNTKKLLLALSGSIDDLDSTEMTFQTNTLELSFETDGENIYDGWELTYNTNVPNKTNDFSKKEDVLIYPNPVMDYLHVRIENIKSDVQLQLYDIYGKLIQELTCVNEQSIIDMNNLSSGIYVLKVKEGKKTTITKKIIKQ